LGKIFVEKQEKWKQGEVTAMARAEKINTINDLAI